MLDEAMVTPATLPSALTIAYRHFDVSSQSTPAFAALIGLAPHASVDEASVNASFASPRGHVGAATRLGGAFDSVRRARAWSAGGTLIWAPQSAARFELAYDEASEITTGFLGRRRSGSVSIHVDL